MSDVGFAVQFLAAVFAPVVGLLVIAGAYWLLDLAWRQR